MPPSPIPPSPPRSTPTFPSLDSVLQRLNRLLMRLATKYGRYRTPTLAAGHRRENAFLVSNIHRMVVELTLACSCRVAFGGGMR